MRRAAGIAIRRGWVKKEETRDAGTGRRRPCLLIASLDVLMVVKEKWSARFGFFAAMFQCIHVFWDVTLRRWG